MDFKGLLKTVGENGFVKQVKIVCDYILSKGFYPAGIENDFIFNKNASLLWLFYIFGGFVDFVLS